MKNWKTTAAGVLGAATVLAYAKGWIDKDTASCIGAVTLIIFGKAAQDAEKN